MEFDAWPLEEVRTGIRVNDRIGDVEVNQVGALSHSHEPEQVVPAPNLEFFEHVPFKVETHLEELRVTCVGFIAGENVETIAPVERHVPFHEVSHERCLCFACERKPVEDARGVFQTNLRPNHAVIGAGEIVGLEEWIRLPKVVENAAVVCEECGALLVIEVPDSQNQVEFTVSQPGHAVVAFKISHSYRLANGNGIGLKPHTVVARQAKRHTNIGYVQLPGRGD